MPRAASPRRRQRADASGNGSGRKGAFCARAQSPRRPSRASDAEVVATIDGILNTMSREAGHFAAFEDEDADVATAAAAGGTRTTARRAALARDARGAAALLPRRGVGQEALAEREEALERQLAALELELEAVAQSELPMLDELIDALRRAEAVEALGWRQKVIGTQVHANATLPPPQTAEGAAERVTGWYERVQALHARRVALASHVADMGAWQRSDYAAALRAELGMLVPAVVRAVAKAGQLEARAEEAASAEACRRSLQRAASAERDTLSHREAAEAAEAANAALHAAVKLAVAEKKEERRLADRLADMQREGAALREETADVTRELKQAEAEVHALETKLKVARQKLSRAKRKNRAPLPVRPPAQGSAAAHGADAPVDQLADELSDSHLEPDESAIEGGFEGDASIFSEQDTLDALEARLGAVVGAAGGAAPPDAQLLSPLFEPGAEESLLDDTEAETLPLDTDVAMRALTLEMESGTQLGEEAEGMLLAGKMIPDAMLHEAMAAHHELLGGGATIGEADFADEWETADEEADKVEFDNEQEAEASAVEEPEEGPSAPFDQEAAMAALTLELEAETKLGREAEELLMAGKLIPDVMLRHALQRAGARETAEPSSEAAGRGDDDSEAVAGAGGEEEVCAHLAEGLRRVSVDQSLEQPTGQH